MTNHPPPVFNADDALAIKTAIEAYSGWPAEITFINGMFQDGWTYVSLFVYNEDGTHNIHVDEVRIKLSFDNQPPGFRSWTARSLVAHDVIEADRDAAVLDVIKHAYLMWDDAKARLPVPA